ncbi:unnamed protein product [Moneuplotes crassus]|uniref:Uncharacterized protein n=1 Tax=Euplotes crassus TaxID=5936 RepID=A0AAD1XRU8_EUPCR|nr:unnamed protein product [Moneuplotes crassus]
MEESLLNLYEIELRQKEIFLLTQLHINERFYENRPRGRIRVKVLKTMIEALEYGNASIIAKTYKSIKFSKIFLIEMQKGQKRYIKKLIDRQNSGCVHEIEKLFYRNNDQLKKSEMISLCRTKIPVNLPFQSLFLTLISRTSQSIYLSRLALSSKQFCKLIQCSSHANQLDLSFCCINCGDLHVPAIPNESLSKIYLNKCFTQNGNDWYQKSPSIQNMLKYLKFTLSNVENIGLALESPIPSEIFSRQMIILGMHYYHSSDHLEYNFTHKKIRKNRRIIKKCIIQ